MERVRTPVKVKSIAGPRVETGRRVKAARMMADVSLRDAAQAAGLTYTHVCAIEHGREPLTSTDALDLGRVLGCPAGWLARGWEAEGE